MATDPPPDTTTISANVRAEMARTHTAQSALARILNLSQDSISRRLRGTTPFTAHELALVSHHLDVPVSTFYQHTQHTAA